MDNESLKLKGGKLSIMSYAEMTEINTPMTGVRKERALLYYFEQRE
jgi:hypothetical protein